MTARPWGTTGRVGVSTKPGYRYIKDVTVDGRVVGFVGAPAPRDGGKWDASMRDVRWVYRAFDSLDAAVMWVLRRADAKLWRQERGEAPFVWRSRRVCPGEWVVEWDWSDGAVRTFATRDDAIATALGVTP